MDQNNSHWPFKTNEPNFEFELILWKLETLHVKYDIVALNGRFGYIANVIYGPKVKEFCEVVWSGVRFLQFV